MKPTDLELAMCVIATRPLTEILPLVKEWLAGEGMVVIETAVVESIDAGRTVCALKCRARHDGATETVCLLGCAQPDDGGDYMHPDPAKCPAMVKAAKEKTP